MAQDEPTETSSLLGNASSVLPDAGNAPNGAPPSNLLENGHTKGSPRPAGDEESQSANAKIAQYEGMPEVKARLKYIVPAISVGVSIHFNCTRTRC